MSDSGITPLELWRLLHAWRGAQIVGLKDDPDALRFESLLKMACRRGDAKFLGQLARVFKKGAAPLLVGLRPSLHVCARTLRELIKDPEALRAQGTLAEEQYAVWATKKASALRARQKEIPHPWRPQDDLEKVRLAYASFDPELHLTWEDVKKLASELFPELNGIDDSHWRKLRRQAGLSWLPSPGRGRPKKDKGNE